MEITKKDVELSAKLAKMRVSEQEAVIYEAQLKELFRWVKELSAVNTDHVVLNNGRFAAHLREDIAETDETRAKNLVAAFHAEQDNQAKVKKVL